MRSAILLCGEGQDAETAAAWAEEQARDARYTKSAADRFADKVRGAYEEACHALVGRGGEQPVMRITLEPDRMTPRFSMVDANVRASRRTPRAERALAILRARAGRKAARTAETEPG